MNVLVTGGYGFIGSFVAERFYKEGYEVVIIDNLSAGDKRNVNFKHKSYLLSIEDRRCEEVFRSTRFDVVVHLAAHADVAASMDNPRLDAESNLLGLVNMLNLSHKYGVRKFIFASSAAVYGQSDRLPVAETEACEPVSPYGLNKMIGETYCRKWQEMYGLETLCFRFSNVYGPHQGRAGAGGVVSAFIKAALASQDLVVYGDGEQTRDFIYVEDVADAVYRASYSGLTGVYNLSTGKDSSVNELIGELRSIHGTLVVKYMDVRPGDFERSALDNRNIKKDLDWSPKYSLQEGLRKTYEWHAAVSASAKEAKAPARFGSPGLRAAFKAVVPYAENLLAFALTAWLMLSVRDSWIDILDLRIVYILLLGMLYGTRQSLIAVALATLLFIYEQLGNGRELVSLLYDSDFLFHLTVYLFVGLVVGYSVERKNMILESMGEQLEALKEKHAFLTDVYHETRKVKDELQQRVLGSGDSFGKIYSVTKSLESLEPEQIFTSTVTVLESLMKAKGVSIYTVDRSGNYLRLAAHSYPDDLVIPKSVRVESEPFARQALHDRKLFVNMELEPGVPLMAAPVISGGKPVAVVAIHEMEFEHFTLYHQNLFSVLVGLVSSALSRALSFVEATENKRYIEGTAILKPEVFAEIVAAKHEAKAKHGIEYVLLSAGPADDARQELSREISRLLRETDYIGIGERGELMVLLSNSGMEEAASVLERLGRNGISLRVAEEDGPYV
ncbi:NAD-dependent epimerase [Paenibacillus sp. 32O-W]|uniref:NAD-dependent epimerase/dehydratase family protein n=1 Tax=Paenibacillus sp. 32O-W TaxID=1695218 RepID=UPI00071F0681|nr:NAD-dependent epimerase/dehydratase family protein [Paenibacillus sp. 32O-W]ALS26341.1 NAD-dependent epimerase [Paenibacillus sp. 32O-W]